MIVAEFDVVVVRAGNAGMCAALAARGKGSRAPRLEAAPFDERGGNSRFVAGALRFVYNGVDDLPSSASSARPSGDQRFRDLHHRPEYDDLGRRSITAAIRIWPNRSSPEPRDAGVDAQPGPPLCADVFEATSSTKEIRVLGRPCARGLGRRLC